MSKFIILSTIFAIALLSTAEGIKCNEGFNISIGGIPFYQWKESECNSNSKCFGQELGVSVGVDVAFTYGACISNSYSDLLDCDSLFGPDSTLDPAQLLNLIPDVEQQFTALVQDFIQESLDKVINIFSADGANIETFVSGIIKFYENIGLNMEKVKPLIPSLAKLLRASFKAGADPAALTAALSEVITAIDNLDTENTDFENAIYSFLGNFFTADQINYIKNDQNLALLIEKLPGLVKSTFPSTWNSESWFDLPIELLEDIDVTNPKQSTIDVINRIKVFFIIPTEVQEVLFPIFDNLPDLVEELAKGNFAYPGAWLLNLLPVYSERDDSTKKFDAALITFIERMNITLQDEFKEMIRWLPGLFYKALPDAKDTIAEVYVKMADGFNSFNWDDLSNTSDTTNLSDFIFDVINKITGQQVANPGHRALIINFSYMFYDLMEDYTTELDKFFTILTNGFSTWPSVNPGKIITDLIEDFGSTVPPEVKPLIDNLQGLVAAAMADPFDFESLLTSITAITDAYKTAFPSSPFPDIFKGFIDNTKEQVLLDWTQPNAQERFSQLQIETIYLQIDFQFALFREMDISGDELTQAIKDAFPEYEVFISVIKAVDPEDVKQLIKDVIRWVASGDLTATNFATETKSTIEKITDSLTGLMADIRAIFRPDYCRFGSCSVELCNNQGFISIQQAVNYKTDTDQTTMPITMTTATTTTTPTDQTTMPITMTTATTTTTPSTTTGAATFSPSFLLNVPALLLAFKALIQ